MRIVGPNCLGLIDTFAPINASFAAGMPDQGSIAFMSQSGALCTAILDYALAENIGFSHFVSLGNKSDVDEVALLGAWQDDPQTNVVIAYIEGIKDGPRFMATARQAAQQADHRGQIGAHSVRVQSCVLSHGQPGRVRRRVRCRF